MGTKPLSAGKAFVDLFAGTGRELNRVQEEQRVALEAVWRNCEESGRREDAELRDFGIPPLNSQSVDAWTDQVCEMLGLTRDDIGAMTLGDLLNKAKGRYWRLFQEQAANSVEAPQNCADNADNEKENPVDYPKNQDVRDLCALLAEERAKPKGKRRSNRKVALGFTGDQKKGDNLLRQCRRKRNLYEG